MGVLQRILIMFKKILSILLFSIIQFIEKSLYSMRGLRHLRFENCFSPIALLNSSLRAIYNWSFELSSKGGGNLKRLTTYLIIIVESTWFSHNKL